MKSPRCWPRSRDCLVPSDYSLIHKKGSHHLLLYTYYNFLPWTFVNYYYHQLQCIYGFLISQFFTSLCVIFQILNESGFLFVYKFAIPNHGFLYTNLIVFFILLCFLSFWFIFLLNCIILIWWIHQVASFLAKSCTFIKFFIFFLVWTLSKFSFVLY